MIFDSLWPWLRDVICWSNYCTAEALERMGNDIAIGGIWIWSRVEDSMQHFIGL